MPQKLHVFAGIGAVHLVIACHHGGWLCALHHQLKGAQVNFAQRALVHLGGNAHALFLLVVHRKMLHARAHARRLDALHHGLPQRRRQGGVFGKVFKIAPAQRAALHVQPGPQQKAHALGRGFFAHGPPHALHQVRAERARQCAFAGKTGGGHAGAAVAAGVQLILFAHAVRSVCHKQAFHAFFRDGLCAPETVPAQKRGFFLQRQGAQLAPGRAVFSRIFHESGPPFRGLCRGRSPRGRGE